jgi:enamine deaminase RidA (YjgF/YER057c/UK114 family)
MNYNCINLKANKYMKISCLLLFFVCISLTLSAQKKEFINPPELSTPRGYTHIVTSEGGKTVYIAGQVPTNQKGEVVGKGDLKIQIQQVYENIKIALKAVGAEFKDVVKMTTYIVNYQPEQIAILREVRSQYLSPTYPPANTLLGVQALFHPDILVEIEVIAVIKK